MLILTGNPGVGKTNVLLKTVDQLNNMGYRVGGMISREFRESGVRLGFEILDLSTNSHGWLAHVNLKSGPQVGKYHVNIEDLEGVGAKAVSDAVEDCDVVAIDEIGPMELFSDKFKEAVSKALGSGKLVVAVVHWKAQNPLVKEAKARADVEIFEVTVDNREKLPEVLVQKVRNFLERS